MPDAKLEKWIIDRRVELLEAEGIEFALRRRRGRDVDADELRRRHDAVVVASARGWSATSTSPGRDLDGVHFAMDYLYQRNRAWPAPRAASAAARPSARSPPPASAW